MELTTYGISKQHLLHGFGKWPVHNGLSYCTAFKPVIKLTFDDSSIDATGY